MADNQFLRQKRDREFQQRVLAAVEKPKSPWIIRFINAPSFLWLMSSIVLAAGVFYYSAYQQCLKDAHDQISSYTRLSRELSEREQLTREIILKAKSVAELRTALPKVEFYPEFKGHKFSVLYKAYNDFPYRIIDFPSPPDGLTDERARRLYTIVRDGQLPRDFSDSALRSLQEDAGSLPVMFTSVLVFVDPLGETMLHPACGYRTITSSIFYGPWVKIVQFVPGEISE